MFYLNTQQTLKYTVFFHIYTGNLFSESGSSSKVEILPKILFALDNQIFYDGIFMCLAKQNVYSLM